MEKTAPSLEWNLAYTGKYLDLVAELQNNLHRWYDAYIAKWISTDPIGFEAGDVNLYRYVNNGPLWQVDPEGLCTQCDRGVEHIHVFDGSNSSTWGPDYALVAYRSSKYNLVIGDMDKRNCRVYSENGYYAKYYDLCTEVCKGGTPTTRKGWHKWFKKNGTPFIHDIRFVMIENPAGVKNSQRANHAALLSSLDTLAIIDAVGQVGLGGIKGGFIGAGKNTIGVGTFYLPSSVIQSTTESALEELFAAWVRKHGSEIKMEARYFEGDKEESIPGVSVQVMSDEPNGWWKDGTSPGVREIDDAKDLLRKHVIKYGNSRGWKRVVRNVWIEK